MTLGALISAVLLGFLAGLFSFKVKERWCPECGASTLRKAPADARTEQDAAARAAVAPVLQVDDRKR